MTDDTNRGLYRNAFERDGYGLQTEGLYVGMRPWESYFLALET